MWASHCLVNQCAAAEDQWIWTILQVLPIRRRTIVSVVVRSTGLPLKAPLIRPSVAIHASVPSEWPARRVTCDRTAF